MVRPRLRSQRRPPLGWSRAVGRLAGLDRPRVAVLCRGAETELLGRLEADAPDATVTVHVLPLPPAELRRRLVAGGPYDLVVDVAGGPRLPRRFAEVVWHVRRDGHLLLRLPDREAPRRFFERLAADHAAGPDAEPVTTPALRPRHRRALLEALRRLDVDGDWLCAEQGLDALPKLAERDAAAFLTDRPHNGATLLTRPGGEWPVRSRVTTSRPHPRNDLPTSYDAPPASLREYHDVVVLPGRASWVEGGVLPESFRFQGRDNLRSQALHEVAPRFVRRPPEPEQRLDGVWYHLSSPLPRHFGHALTEQLSHAWGWHEARERHPSLRALLVTRPERTTAPYERELLVAAGIEPELITEVTEPVRVERLVDTTALYDIGHFVHPEMARVYDEVGASLAARSTTTDRPARLFHTRRQAKRRCRNQAEVEALFAEFGFEVVAPEDSPLPDQAARIRSAEVVAGFAGSGLFHVGLAAQPLHVIVITHEGYPAHNEYLLSALRGHRLDLAVCPPDVPRTGPGYERAGFHSDFVVAEPELTYLRRVLETLPAANAARGA